METPQVAANDWTLLSAFIQGDEAAFEAIVARYFRMVYSLAARQVGDPHLAEEVAQSVFIILARKASKLSSGVTLCGWLAQTTRFVARDANKSRRRRVENEQRFAASLDAPGVAPHGGGNTIELLLNEALLALPATEQAGVVAHFLEGKNFKEVGEMLAIGEDAAQKRVSRSLDKLRSFLVRRGAKMPATAVAGILAAGAAREASAHGMQFAAAGKAAGGPARELADHALRALWWRSAATLGLKLALVVLLVTGGFLGWREWRAPRRAASQAFDPRIDALGREWSRMVLQFDALKPRMARPDPTDPGFQALLNEVNALGQESARIRNELAPLLIPPGERADVAEFLTAEVAATIELDNSQRAAVFKLVSTRLARGATLKEAMALSAGEIPAIALQIKAVLTPDQRQRFDTIYSINASGLFAYLKSATAGQPGPPGQPQP